MRTSAATKLQRTRVKAETVQVLGSTIDLMSAAEAVDEIEKWVSAYDRRCRRVVVTGFHGLLYADKHPKIHAVLNEADLWLPDGIAPVLIARLHGHRNVTRTPGTQLVREFLKRANEKGYSSYFYGSDETTLAALRKNIESKYPGHRIAGMYAPPFRPITPEEDREAIEGINEAQPDVLWVGLGAPRQDVWISERQAKLKVPVAAGVGAAFAFLAGTVPRCPEWLGRMGFEWAYRLAKEPRKLWRRDLVDGPDFLFRIGIELARLRRRAWF
jgi:N-acetylglucosaminyldiphosphoundecaprenol N-acetyl-beta-D-mannosaminyltransferase